MQLPEYVTKEEVRKVCKQLKIRDWTKLKNTSIRPEEAKIIFSIVNTEKMPVSVEDFKVGLEVELEHGVMFADYNVTNNHPILTGRIVMAHFKEMLDYYKRLEVAEIEGDILKAVVAGNMEKIRKYHKKLAAAQAELAESEASQLKK